MRLGTFATPEGEHFAGEVHDDHVHRLAAPTMLGWLAGEGRERAAETYAAAELTTLAPVPEPPGVRDFYAFERHVQAGARLRGKDVADYWYEAPAFYFSNPASIVGPGAPVRRPDGVALLDFELEIAAIIGVPLGGPAGELAIAGFTLMNDWSARDVQAQEVTVGLGPHKAKDFATSLGPHLVTPDELPYRDGRLELHATVAVNAAPVAAAEAGHQHFPWPELVAHAARNTRLRPGDVLGSGTLAGGCLQELGPLPAEAGGDGRRWLEPGDDVTLRAERLGELNTPVVA
jgi:2-keto-4-pentenoate hydratase/2-oxohepta-3-ene-1,7-dioic acid hydratase in catechol pathway